MKKKQTKFKSKKGRKMSFLKEFDNDIYELCQKELERQTDHLEMIASENFTLPAVMEAMGSVFTNKYAE